MRLKMSGATALIAAFVALVLAAATVLLSGGEATSASAPVAVAAPAVAKPANAKPATAAPVSTPMPAADERFVIKRILPITGPIRYGEWHWDETGVPAGGHLVITVDLDARVLSVFRDGYEIGATAVLLGTQEKPTPTGVFPITQKKVHHISNLYDAPMPYMQRLTNDGISIHATNVENGYASHGCIGTPLDFAKKLFEQTRPGDKVYITRGQRVGLGDSLVGT